MTKILVECQQCIASVRVGVLEPLKQLEQQNVCTIRYMDTMKIKKEDIAWCDILICVRGCEVATLSIVKAAKKADRFIIYFLDDDLLHIPEGNASTAYFSDATIKKNLTEILSLSNVLWAVNPCIIDYYSKWCHRTALLKVPADVVKEPVAVKKPIKILYAGSIDHESLVQDKLAPAVKKLLNQYPDEVEFTFIGANPHLDKQKGYEYYSFFDSYDAYREKIAKGDYVLGLAPAYTTPFYHCKYFNKYIEYSSYGIAGIYEDTPPYTDIVQNGENGFLCAGGAEQWYETISKLIYEPDQITKAAYNAQKILKKQFARDNITHEILIQIPEIQSYKACEISESEVELKSMFRIFVEERLKLMFRVYGIAACFVIAYKVVKKLVKYLKEK